MKKNKRTIIWFIDASGMPGPMLAAKMKQINDWIKQTKPFEDDINLLLVPARESKFCMLETPEEFKGRFSSEKEALDWLASIKDKMKNCLQVNIFEKEIGKLE